MRRFFCIVLQLLFIQNILSAQETRQDTISLSKLEGGYSLSNRWVFHIGDDPLYANPKFIDSSWAAYDTDSSEDLLDSVFGNPPVMVWFRYPLYIDSSLNNQILALEIVIRDACEIYLNGNKIETIGTLEATGRKGVSGFSMNLTPIPIKLESGKSHLLAIRYSHFSETDPGKELRFDVLNNVAGFQISLSTLDDALEELKDTSETFTYSFFSGIFITLSLFHFILFLFYRSNRTNLYYSLFSLFLFIIFFGIYKISSGSDFYTSTRIGVLEMVSILCTPLLFIALLYQIFYKRLLIYYWILTGVVVTGMLLLMLSNSQSVGVVLIILFIIASLVEILRIYIKAWRRKKEGAGIFVFGILIPPVGVTVLAIFAFVLSSFGSEKLAEEINDMLVEFFGYTMLLSVSISMTIYLAKDFSRINMKLNQQLNEIRQLLQKTIMQENEKKKILENQNVELENKVQERTSELKQKNRDILDNLHYAQRIQSAILPEVGLIYQILTDSFILYRPKDIVSGDFYTFSQKNGKVVIAAADCTGHGVTGAFLSMIGISLMNQLVNESGYTQPAQILNQLNTGIVSSLRQKVSEVSDGMDIAICSFDLQNNLLEYAGANRPLYLLRDGIIEEVKADKLAIGGFRLNAEATFSNHQLKLNTGDIIYIFTDGYADQFGGEQGKKLLSKRLREMFISMKDLSMREQEHRLTTFFDEWKGSHEQVDDVLLIGIRV
ncbi:MAG: SpoIIE family protein phosphatase [Bacteroidia bacterium]|nr:SpoIIE family protein phosphatase [Bacteroidia bacterium]